MNAATLSINDTWIKTRKILMLHMATLGVLSMTTLSITIINVTLSGAMGIGRGSLGRGHLGSVLLRSAHINFYMVGHPILLGRA